MNNYQVVYEDRFDRNLKRFSSLRQRIRRKVEQILVDPYDRTEQLGKVSGGLDLRGCRSSRIDRNFRIIFVICEECQLVKECLYCYCEGRDEKTVVFFDCRTTFPCLYNELRQHLTDFTYLHHQRLAQ